jgi:hypothetical protein
MRTATVVAGERLSNLNWGPVQHREKSIRRMVDESRGWSSGSGVRSRRGFGIQRSKNEFVAGMASWREGWYYDTVTVAAAAAFPQTTFMFSQAQTGAKNLSSTNLTGQGGQMPAGITLSIKRIRVEISNLTTPADYANIVSNVTFEFKTNQVPIYQALPNFFPAGFGTPMFSAAQVGTAPTGSSALTNINNGMPTQGATYEFEQAPYQLSSQETFVVVLTAQNTFNMVAASGTNPLGVGTTIRVYLDGLKKGIISG